MAAGRQKSEAGQRGFATPPASLQDASLVSHACLLRNIIEGDISIQAKQAIENVGEILKAAGSDYTKVVKTTCFLADMNDFAAFNAVYEKYFTEKPARSCVAVKTLPKNVLCEVEIIAEV